MRRGAGAIVTPMQVLTDAKEPLHPLSVDAYHRMIEAGILSEDDKVELLDGALIASVTEGPAHADVVADLAEFLMLGIDRERYKLRIGNPLTLRPLSEPEPDLAVVERSASTRTHHPSTALLVVEVSQTSLARDRERKARIYAAAEVPEYWIVDLAHSAIEVRSDPGAHGYRELTVYGKGDAVCSAAVELPVLEITGLFAAR